MSKITAIITAGGNSTRFGTNKLLEKIGNLSVIETTISKFRDVVDEIIIPAGSETKEFLLSSSFCSEIKFAPAGKTRQQSVYNALIACKDCDIVLIHDGARPYIKKETILEAIELAKKHEAVIVGKMATDTIKIVENGKIIKTIDRTTVFHAETPQAFKFDLIKKLHEKYKDNPNFTDDSILAEKEGCKPYILISKECNKKITTKDDLIIL